MWGAPLPRLCRYLPHAAPRGGALTARFFALLSSDLREIGDDVHGVAQRGQQMQAVYAEDLVRVIDHDRLKELIHRCAEHRKRSYGALIIVGSHVRCGARIGRGDGSSETLLRKQPSKHFRAWCR